MAQTLALNIQDVTVLNPILCQKTLDRVAFAAQQSASPFSPVPLFFSSGACNAGLNGSVFPNTAAPVSCPADPLRIPLPVENCLRILKGTDARRKIISTQDVNFLRNPQRSVPDSSMFPNSDDMLFSFYIPPDYLAYFFENDPRGKSLEDLENSDVLIVSGDHVEVNACRSELTLPNGKSFFEPNAAVKKAVETNIATATILGSSLSRFSLSLFNRSEPFDEQACASASTFYVHRTPFVVLVELQDFHKTILDMCLKNRTVSIGTTSLNQVWRPQFPACDALVAAFCATNSTDEPCACFRQQNSLDDTFGRQRKVPVCCFGKDPSGDQDRSCAFNRNAYKTREMLDNCCTLVQCNQQARVLTSLEPSAIISCVEDTDKFPIKGSKTTTFVEPFFDKLSNIPTWVVMVALVTGILMLVYIVLLVFC